MIDVKYLQDLFETHPYVPRNLWLYDESPFCHRTINIPTINDPIENTTIFDFDACFGVLLEHNRCMTFRLFIPEFDLEIHSSWLDTCEYAVCTINGSTYEI